MTDMPLLLTGEEVKELGLNPDDYTPVGWYYPPPTRKGSRVIGEPLYRSSDL